MNIPRLYRSILRCAIKQYGWIPKQLNTHKPMSLVTSEYHYVFWKDLDSKSYLHTVTNSVTNDFYQNNLTALLCEIKIICKENKIEKNKKILIAFFNMTLFAGTHYTHKL